MNAKGMYLIATLVAIAFGLFGVPEQAQAAPGGDVINIDSAVQGTGVMKVKGSGTFFVDTRGGRKLQGITLIILDAVTQKAVSTTTVTPGAASSWSGFSNNLPAGSYAATASITTWDACNGNRKTTQAPTQIFVTIN